VMYRKVLAGVALMVVSLSAYSATLHYDEEISGDIYWNSEFIGILDEGVNTITGHAGLFRNNGNDLDDARVRLLENQQITDIGFSVSNLQDSGRYTIFSVSAIYNGTYPVIDKAFFYMNPELTDYNLNNSYVNHMIYGNSWEGSIFSSTLPFVTDGYYNFGVNSFSGALQIEFDYTWTINVASTSPVPIPASFWLFATALMGFIAITRKRTTEAN
jgi:hypothetical protein